MFGPHNPYHVSGPITDPLAFIGRQDIIASIWEAYESGQRALVVTGEPLMGKSSLLLYLEQKAPPDCLAVYINLSGEEWAASERLFMALVAEVRRRLLPDDGGQGDAPDPSGSVDAWKQVRELIPAKRVMILLDDLDRLPGDGGDVAQALLGLLDADPDVMIVCAVRPLFRPLGGVGSPLAEAPVLALGPYNRVDAYTLIRTWLEEECEVDYEAIERIDELTGRLPYFIQLLCGQIFELRRGSGHIGVVDIESAIQALADSSVRVLEDAWATSSSEGKFVLSLLGSFRGAYEVFTPKDIKRVLKSHDIEAEVSDIARVVEELAEAGVLQQLGALSYRFRVELFRYWLRWRHPIEQTKRAQRWQPERHRPAEPDGEPVLSDARRGSKVTVPLLMPLLVLMVAIVFMIARGQTAAEPSPAPTATPPLATLAAILSAPIGTPSPSASSESGPIMSDGSPPVVTPTATLPSVVAWTTVSPMLTDLSVSAIAYAYGADGERSQIWLLDVDGGSPMRLTAGWTEDYSPAWSPDGMRLAFVSERTGNKEIFAMEIGSLDVSNLTNNEADEVDPAWSRDGSEIAFSSARDGNAEIYVMWADGADPIRLTDDPGSDVSPTWSPDGRRIAFASDRDGNWEIYAMGRDGKDLERLTDSPWDDRAPVWSPDGRYIAFESSRDGNWEIYRMLADGDEPRNLTGHGGRDRGPTWSPDGSYLAFSSDRDGGWNIFVMTADGEDVLRVTHELGESQWPAWRPQPSR